MKKAIVLVCLSLSGCFYQTINRAEIDWAQRVCSSHGGIGSMTSLFDGSERVDCLDGAMGSFIPSRLPREIQ